MSSAIHQFADAANVFVITDAEPVSVGNHLNARTTTTTDILNPKIFAKDLKLSLSIK